MVLESADVNSIAAEEGDTGKPAKPKRRTYNKNTLPVVKNSDHEIWSEKLLPELIDWCGTQSGQFSFSNNPKFHKMIKDLWDQHLGSLVHIPLSYKNETTNIPCRDHPAVLSFVCVHSPSSIACAD